MSLSSSDFEDAPQPHTQEGTGVRLWACCRSLHVLGRTQLQLGGIYHWFWWDQTLTDLFSVAVSKCNLHIIFTHLNCQLTPSIFKIMYLPLQAGFRTLSPSPQAAFHQFEIVISPHSPGHAWASSSLLLSMDELIWGILYEWRIYRKSLFVYLFPASRPFPELIQPVGFLIYSTSPALWIHFNKFFLHYGFSRALFLHSPPQTDLWCEFSGSHTTSLALEMPCPSENLISLQGFGHCYLFGTDFSSLL